MKALQSYNCYFWYDDFLLIIKDELNEIYWTFAKIFVKFFESILSIKIIQNHFFLKKTFLPWDIESKYSINILEEWNYEMNRRYENLRK